MSLETRINFPVKAIYIETQIDWSSPIGTDVKRAIDAGYNYILVAFYLETGPHGHVAEWMKLDDSVKREISDYAHSKKAVILVSFGGATSEPYLNYDAQQIGTDVGNFAVQHHFDGVDFDLEHFVHFGTELGIKQLEWTVTATTAAYQAYGPNAIISHAPQAPHFSPDSFGPGYQEVYRRAPFISLFLIQYYNQGDWDKFITFNSIFIASNYKGAAIKEIIASGIPAAKLSVGKPVATIDVYNTGYVEAHELGQLVEQAFNDPSLGWRTGIMAWQWRATPGNISAWDWIKAVFPGEYQK